MTVPNEKNTSHYKAMKRFRFNHESQVNEEGIKSKLVKKRLAENEIHPVQIVRQVPGVETSTSRVLCELKIN